MSVEMIRCIQDANEVLAFDLPDSECVAFLKFHNFITSPQPRFITEWRASARDDRWYHALVGGVNRTMRGAYAAVLYHFQNLAALEAQVMEKISQTDFEVAIGDRSVAIGNTKIWDFEYHAFIFAYRRCLDYLTRALAAYFKHEFHSFNSFPKGFKNLKPESVARALIDVHAKHYENFSFVMSAGGKRSVRDKIPHYEWVDAGTINLTRYGLVLIGGGEDLEMTIERHNTAQLSDALASRVEMLKACIDEMLLTFVAEARAWEEKGA